MWKHYCPIDKTWISVKTGEPCNWCDARPQSVVKPPSDTKSQPIEDPPSADFFIEKRSSTRT